MRNFKIYKAFISICIIVLVVVSIFMFQTKGLNYRTITNPDDIEGVVIGNSHANRILLNNKNFFYLNENGGVITDSIKEFSYANRVFPNLKYVILNITPVEMYINKISTNLYENEFLYSNAPQKYWNIFKKNITVDFFDFYKIIKSIFFSDLDYRINGNSFSKNGYQYLSNETHGVVIDWVRESHYKKDIFIPNNKLYLDNLYKIKKTFANNNVKAVVISMPLNYRYVAHMKDKLNHFHLFDLSQFTDDMQSIFSECYINLIQYPLPDKYFWDGDHLNKDGAVYLTETVDKKINKCLNSH